MTIVVKAEQPLFPNELFDPRGGRERDVDLDAVVLSHPIEEAVGLGVKPAGIEAENRKREPALGRHVDEEHVFRTAERDGTSAAPSLETPSEDLGRIAIGELSR